jgi:hypothetical protein
VEWGIGPSSVNPDVLANTQRIIAAAEPRLLLESVRQRLAAGGSEQVRRPSAPDVARSLRDERRTT